MPTIKENLQELHRVITAYPEDQLKLQKYHTCGTIFCAAGLAATLPFFMDQMSLQPVPPEDGNFYTYASDLSEMEEMWGENSFHRLFSIWRDGLYDLALLDNGGISTDKELILARIEYALAHDV